MGRTLSILVVAAVVLAFLVAILLAGPVVAIVPLVSLAAGVFMIMLRHRNGYIAGGIVVAFSIVALLLSVGGISGEDAEVGTATAETGQATAIASALVAAGALLGIRWGTMEPTWMPVVWLVILLVGVGLAYGFKDGLGNPADAMNFVVGIVVLAGGVPPLLQAIRDEPVE